MKIKYLFRSKREDDFLRWQSTLGLEHAIINIYEASLGLIPDIQRNLGRTEAKKLFRHFNEVSLPNAQKRLSNEEKEHIRDMFSSSSEVYRNKHLPSFRHVDLKTLYCYTGKASTSFKIDPLVDEYLRHNPEYRSKQFEKYGETNTRTFLRRNFQYFIRIWENDEFNDILKLLQYTEMVFGKEDKIALKIALIIIDVSCYEKLKDALKDVFPEHRISRFLLYRKITRGVSHFKDMKLKKRLVYNLYPDEMIKTSKSIETSKGIEINDFKPTYKNWLFESNETEKEIKRIEENTDFE